jgi:hypothetical protein
MWDAVPSLIRPRLRRDVFYVVRVRVGVHWTEVEADFAGVGIEPRHRVLHPVLIVAVGEVLGRIRRRI